MVELEFQPNHLHPKSALCSHCRPRLHGHGTWDTNEKPSTGPFLPLENHLPHSSSRILKFYNKGSMHLRNSPYERARSAHIICNQTFVVQGEHKRESFPGLCVCRGREEHSVYRKASLQTRGKHMLQFNVDCPPKAHVLNAWFPECRYWEVVEPKEAGSNGRKLHHWGRSLKGGSRTPPSLSPSSSWIQG